MLLMPGSQSRRLAALALFAVSIFFLSAASARAQVVAAAKPDDESSGHSVVRESSEAKGAAPEKKPETTEEKLNALEQMLLEQGQRLNQLQQTIAEQQETIRLLASKLTAGEHSTATSGPTTSAGTGATGVAEPGATVATQPAPSIDSRLKKVEDRVADIGAIKIDGDVRLRAESFFGLSNNLANGDTPTALGNDLSTRNRFRLRARLRLSGGFGEEFDCGGSKCKEFEWALRLATGSLADNISTNQTLTDFFSRKPFALDQAFISYRPVKFGGRLQLQGGKFEAPWVARFEAPWPHPEMMFDNDLMVEGFTQSYTHSSKTSSLRELKFVAWQLPFLERNSAFVRNPNGTVNITESRRGGRDLALYGGQIRARWELSPKVALHLSVADLYFSGTQFISPVQVFGNQLLLPLTFVIPASGSTPAQTITTQVAISRDLLVAGNGNLGVTNASNNATNRDGRLSSGFNLDNTLVRLDLKYSQRWPVTFISNFVVNTQVRDVIAAGPGGTDLILPNDERYGFWGEVQLGRAKEPGDWAIGYTLMRIQKDAVLTPFNFSDITQQSDVRVHRVQFGYVAVPGRMVDNKRQDARVLIAITGIVTERPNGVLGPFLPTPPGSTSPASTRLQFDTILRF
jgi:hypothetical protein